jgi:DNA-binding CsgD family transcriptional regulator
MLACEAICGLFAAQIGDIEAWLDAACGQVLMVAKSGLEEVARAGRTNSESIDGVWAGLVEGDPWGERHPPYLGLAGFGDEFQREDVRARVLADLNVPTARVRAVKRSAHSDGSRSPEAPPQASLAWTGRLGSFSTIVDDGHGVQSVIFVGVAGKDGVDLKVAAQTPAVQSVCRALARAAAERIIRPRAGRRRMAAGLSSAQRQVLELLIEGITEHEIARRLGRSRHTVHDHVRTIYKNLGMGSKAELIAAWNEAGRR